jgi:putative ABC transport system permease protein
MPLALRILVNNLGRLAVSTGGIVLAIVLMFSQAGFRNGMFDSQTELVQRLNGELFLVGRLKVLLFLAEPFPSRRLQQARACPGVRAAYALYTETEAGLWKNPTTGRARAIRVLAFDPSEPVLDIPEVRARADQLRQPDTVLFDEDSRDYFGRPGAGTQTELSGQNVRVVGTFRLGTDFLTDGTVVMSDRNYQKLFAAHTSSAEHLERVAIGVIRLDPDADRRVVQERLRQTLPEDVLVLTRQELTDLEVAYWKDNTAIGFIFNLGLAVGFVIGTAICYQVLHSNVSSCLPQLATLKAMGFTDRYLAGVVLQQGLFLALLAFLPAVGVAWGLFSIVAHLTGLLLFLTSLRLLFILGVAVLMCMISGLVAASPVLRADPAEVFR